MTAISRASSSAMPSPAACSAACWGRSPAALVFAGGQRLLPELADTGFGLSPLQWAELALLPLAAALLAMATARYTVLAALAKMM